MNTVKTEGVFRQDTSALKLEKKSLAELPDTNFTFEKYASFLKKVSDTSKFIVLPINEFRQTFNSKKIIIGLRHDVDNDLNAAYHFSETESSLGFRSTYYILHTAPYYLATAGNMAVHTDKMLPILKSMQNDRHFEIGWHNDLVTLQAVYNMDPVVYFKNELAWLRSNGIQIYGSASHGSNYCYVYKYLNYYFFEECTSPTVGQFVNNLNLPIDGKMVPMKKGKLSDFDLGYEAYFLDNNKYFSDASITAGIRWNIGKLDISQLRPGDRVIILLHPIHWHKASVHAIFESFKIEGHSSATIDAAKSLITVKMPYGTDKSSLKADFTLSPGAVSKISGNLQVANVTVNNFSYPLNYTVYAENSVIRREWNIKVENEKNNACSFETFQVQGLTKKVVIDPILKTIRVEISEGAPLTNLKIQYQLSAGARAFIGNNEQFSNTGTINFINSIQYKVLAEDGVNSNIWTVSVINGTVGIEDHYVSPDSLMIFPNPSSGNISMKFQNISKSPLNIVIYDSQGKIVYSLNIYKKGNFEVGADLRKLPAGIYLVKYLNSRKPVRLVIKNH